MEPGARLEQGSILLSGSVVGPGLTIPAYTVWQGNPAQFVRDATPQDIETTKSLISKNKEAGKQHAQLVN